MTTSSWYRRSVWSYKGNREYTKSGYDLAKERFIADDLDVDCSDRHYVITGSNSGIGLEITREVAKRGGVLHMVCRNFEAAKAARSDIITNTGNDKIHIHTLDLARPTEVMKWAQEFAATHEKIHVLVNNAGCMVHERRIDEDGIETNFAVNTLSVHIITMNLLPVLQRNEDARVITVSSAGMLTVRLDPIDIMHEDMEPFNGRLVYSQNKRQQVVMTLWYAQRFEKVHFSVMHPGWADTPAVRTSIPDFYEMMKDNLRTPSEGADTAVWLAISKSVLKHPSGLFYQDREPVSTHLPLAWTKSSIEEENLFMQKLMLLMQKISNKISPEQIEVNGDNNSEVNAHIHTNGVNASLESSNTSPNNVQELSASLKEVSLNNENGNLSAKEEVEDDQTEKQSQVPVEDIKSEGQAPDAEESAELQNAEAPSPEIEDISPIQKDSVSKVLEDSGIDSREEEAGEKADEASVNKSDTSSVGEEEPAAQTDEKVEKEVTPSPVPNEIKNPETDSTTPDKKDEPEPEIIHDKNEASKLETIPDSTSDNPKETPPLEVVSGTPNSTEEFKEERNDSKPETPQPGEKEEPRANIKEESPQNNEALPSEDGDSASRPITSESRADADVDASLTSSPTPTDQTYLSATSVVEHLIDITAAKAGDP
ncbi:uncharacterized protein LOC135198810 [Macrobrachium nipponense]|uniref:uncharacterized protein LOC135198810 n=1 Tax=Macrobrachium nipponense TaxID=159736 RepID=UPI0030C880BA